MQEYPAPMGIDSFDIALLSAGGVIEAFDSVINGDCGLMLMHLSQTSGSSCDA